MSAKLGYLATSFLACFISGEVLLYIIKSNIPFTFRGNLKIMDRIDF